MSYLKKITLLFVLACLVLFSLCSAALCTSNDSCIAIAYTGENYQGVSWKIYKSGEYDLWWKIDWEAEEHRMKFNLPNDSICSIKICPGYTVLLYKDAEIRGNEFILKHNIESLGPEWNRQTSSLTVFVDEDRRLLRRWWRSIDSDKGKFTVAKYGPDRSRIAKILEENRKKFTELMTAGESQWYGGTSDEQRVDAAGFIIELFRDLGYDVSAWTGGAFAQQMNNYYDWRKDLSVWRVACMVLNVDAEMYENIFAETK